MKTRLIFPCAILISLSTAQAVPLWWDGSTADGFWSTADNWSTVVAGGGAGAVPTSADAITFSATGVVSPQVITLTAAQEVSGITVETAGITTLQSSAGGSKTLSIGAGGISALTGVTQVNVGPVAGATAVNVLLTADQSWIYSGVNAANNGILVRGNVSNSGGAHTLTLGGGTGSTAVSAISGVISDGAGAMSITLNGSSTSNRWNLNGNNTYTGVTTITSGALGLGNANALGNTSAGTTVASGASLFLRAGVSYAAESLTITGTGSASAGALRGLAGGAIWNGAINANPTGGFVAIGSDSGQFTLSNTADITFNGSGTLRFANQDTGSTAITVVNGDIIGSNNVEKTVSSSSFLTFGGDAKSYSGATTITTGTFTLNTTLTNSSGLTVAAPGILRGDSGVLANAAASTTINGTLRPGLINSTIGTLALGQNLTFGSAARFEADIQSATLGGDLVTMTGNLNIDNGNAAVLALSDLNVSSITTGTIILMKYGGLWNGGLFTVDGTAITDNGNTFVVNGNTYQLDYNLIDGAGHALALVAVVPEPSSMIIAGITSLGFLARRRRKASL